MTGNPPALASAADLEGRDLGGGRISLRWAYPLDPATHGIRFDVYSALEPLDPFRTLRLDDYAATTAELAGFEQGGDVYVTVIARQGAVTALPSQLLHLSVQPVTQPVALVPATAGAQVPSGLGFPFAVDGTGSVFAQGGDPLLRGKILQLLLTSPGERVNLPEYGTRLKDLVFDPNNDVLAAATEFAVARALMRFLSDELQVDQVQVSADESELSVDIVYVRKSDLHTERLSVGVPIPR
ncbi:MAG: GPW/gp25 family protein [Micromonosporaceae bacterium]